MRKTIPLRRLITADLKVSDDVKQPNGLIIHEYAEIGTYNIVFYELTDEVSAHIYGANLNKTFRISSPNRVLESLLSTKVNTTSDNISNYFIYIEDRKYRIVSVKLNWVDIELI